VAVAIQAHRGSTDAGTGTSENTLAAFARAAALGADGVELDVRLTADGALAVVHDPEVPGRGPVAGLVVADLPADVPLLAEALAVCGDLTVNIEIKNLPTEPGHDPDDAVADAVAALVVELGMDDQVVISSFWPPSLTAVRRAAPQLATGLLVAPFTGAAAGLSLAGELGVSAIHPHHSLVDPEVVTAAHGAGLAVATWTVDDAETMGAVADAGVDTVITDDVPLAVGVLSGRAGNG